MKSFAAILDDSEIVAVTAFVLETLVRCAASNTRYHTAENGWPDHERRNGAAFPFVQGILPVNGAEPALTPAQRSGLSLFKRTCSICHESAVKPPPRPSPPEDVMPDTASPARHRAQEDPSTASREYSAREDHEEKEYGRGYDHGEANEHDRIPFLTDLTSQQRAGRILYQRACALCHAADGTGRNWIGSFLDPSPPAFGDSTVAARLDDEPLRQAILHGLPNTSMPAFRDVLETEQIDEIIAYVRRAFLNRTP